MNLVSLPFLSQPAAAASSPDSASSGDDTKSRHFPFIFESFGESDCNDWVAEWAGGVFTRHFSPLSPSEAGIRANPRRRKKEGKSPATIKVHPAPW